MGADGPTSDLRSNAGTYLVTSSPTKLTAYGQREGMQITTDAGGTGTVYGRLDAQTPTQASHHFSLAPGDSWAGQVSQAVWSGPVTLASTGSIEVAVIEV